MDEFSKTEQDYLKAIYQLQDKTKGLVGITDIANYLKVAAPSATEMIKRLAKKELVEHKKYYGVSLKPEGYQEARFILKSHRVWETFLVEQAGYQIDEVHEEAENLEHASSKRLVERLYTLMNFPKTDPHGSEIPSERFWKGDLMTLDLSQARLEHRYEVVAISEEIAVFLSQLTIKQPKFITVVSHLSDASVIVKTDDGIRFVIPKFQKTSWQLAYYSN
ncbi:metal-dependent transcriptional regulator [Pseudolactococcus paracarnosus]|uniref:Manganese transport regulator n=1 Tax=Pseudolactococcus paracarnosus TaxID=2749962 RepID=A0ABT0AP45_9LACT|nr:metal-dependent transcriptional regulator [Lactococcus paracarnosus]MCJ1978342.1 metal-dependent transcriptional regulator [Lactococcus paracarnosus]MCJ1984504.1 metal-dependent transcriptional regulator [Lactococcus paracarnosus]MCJ1998938.1 metal-dependent transcriptional regulator [Lactococcus paracarnosus]